MLGDDVQYNIVHRSSRPVHWFDQTLLPSTEERGVQNSWIVVRIPWIEHVYERGSRVL